MAEEKALADAKAEEDAKKADADAKKAEEEAKKEAAEKQKREEEAKKTALEQASDPNRQSGSEEGTHLC